MQSATNVDSHVLSSPKAPASPEGQKATGPHGHPALPPGSEGLEKQSPLIFNLGCWFKAGTFFFKQCKSHSPKACGSQRLFLAQGFQLQKKLPDLLRAVCMLSIAVGYELFLHKIDSKSLGLLFDSLSFF